MQKRLTGKTKNLNQWEERVGVVENFGGTGQWGEENVLGIEGGAGRIEVQDRSGGGGERGDGGWGKPFGGERFGWR